MLSPIAVVFGSIYFFFGMTVIMEVLHFIAMIFCVIIGIIVGIFVLFIIPRFGWAVLSGEV